jgi:hypothetical protein
LGFHVRRIIKSVRENMRDSFNVKDTDDTAGR